MSNAKLLKKITLKEVCELGRDKTTEQVKAFFLEKAKQNAELVAIAGDMTGYGGKMTQYGESFFLTGVFFAQNRVTKALYKASKIYLPKDATETIIAAFQNRKQEADHVHFKLSVKVVEDASATGYTYICEPVASPESINREAELEASFLALPAPKSNLKIAGKK